MQLNKDSFRFSKNATYPYFTRTTENNGIAGYVEYLDDKHLMKGGCLAVGMLGMKFYYMQKDFYAGQFTKRIVAKDFVMDKNVALYFKTVFDKHADIYLSVLVRDFKETFENTTIKLPVDKTGKIDFEFINTYITLIQKLAIKDIIGWKDKVIKETKRVVG